MCPHRAGFRSAHALAFVAIAIPSCRHRHPSPESSSASSALLMTAFAMTATPRKSAASSALPSSTVQDALDLPAQLLDKSKKHIVLYVATSGPQYQLALLTSAVMALVSLLLFCCQPVLRTADKKVHQT